MSGTVEQPTGSPWEAWMSTWEDHLSAMVAFVADPADSYPPEPPTLAQPDGNPPAALRTRLVRAEALRQQVTRGLAAHLAAGRRWDRPDPETATRTLGTL